MRRLYNILAIALLATLAGLGAATAQLGPGPFAAFPSQDAKDGRFLGFGCAGLATFEQNVQIALAAPASTTSFDLNIFDGDTGSLDGAARRHWDLGTRQLKFSLYADPLRIGSQLPTDLIGQWFGNAVNPTSGPLWTSSAAQMPDNAWWAATVTNAAIAKAPSGNYFYNFVIDTDGACGIGEQLESNLKIAASNPMNFRTPRFGLVAGLRQTANDIPIIYPGSTAAVPLTGSFLTAPTTYDGTFEFFFTLPGGETELRLFDGDFDYGTSTVVGNPSGVPLDPCFDQDDPDTSPLYLGFPFVTLGANPEGVQGPGSPPDDNFRDVFRRGELGDPNHIGCVRYEVTDPEGNVYFNDNPSGSFEWEQFLIASSGSLVQGDADWVYSGSTLPSGMWKVTVIGLDLANLNFWFADTCATRPSRDPLPGESPDEVPRIAACSDESIYLLGDFVWSDTANPGVLDPGEAGIPGVTMELVRPLDGAVIATAITGDTTAPNWAACVANNTGTDTNGLYCFGTDFPGLYTVRVASSNFGPGGALEGKTSTTGGNSKLDTVLLNNVLTYDFGYRQGAVNNASVGDRVWYDSNGDGIQDAGEAGINGVSVELLDNGGNVVATQATTGDGDYLFDNLAAGSYSVRVVAATLPAGVAETYDLDGIGTANIASFTLATGDHKTNVDFGYRGTASVGDRVWLDGNGNAAQDPGETGINGVTVELLDNGGNVVASQVTSGDGNYNFTDLDAGSYSVRVVSATLPAGLAPSYDLDGIATANVASFSLAGGQHRTDVDFGYKGNASVGDRVWLDTNGDGIQDVGEAGINGVSVELLNSGGTVVATQVTSGDGNYLFTSLAAGNYSVRVVAATLPAGVAQTYDLDGIGTANIAAFTLAAGQNRTDVDFGYRGTASVGDRVWLDSDGDGVQDAGENGINGVTVELLNSGGTVIASQATSGDGNYLFANLMAGNYSVRVVTATLPAGVAQTYDLDGIGTANIAAFSLAGGQNKTDVDFGYRGTASVGDRVWYDTDGDGVQDAGEVGINGVTAELLNSGGTVIASQATAGDGGYLFGNLMAGNYSVRVVVATLPAGVAQTYDLDGTATANIAAFTLAAGQNRTDVDFGYRGTASVGDRVWIDSDGDGVQDAGEVGINGVTVELLNSGGTVIASQSTAGNGNYLFSNLAAGNYSVRVVAATLPAGLAQTYDLDGIGTANIAAFTLAAGQNRTDVDFGYRGTASVGDRVWNDTDGDHTQDAGEAGINGVTVQLLDGGGNVIASQITSGDGNYTFSGLLLGTYTVRIDPATLPANYGPTYDLDGVGSAHQATFNLTASRTDVDFGYRGPVDSENCITKADEDPSWGGDTGGHAIYMPGIGLDFIFTPAPGSFVTHLDGTASITGTVRRVSNPNQAFLVTLQLSGFSVSIPPGSPKRDLDPPAYVENGGPVDTSSWTYYTTYSGTLTGIGEYAGALLNLTNTGPAFQVGIGANGKNINFGGSAWFNWTVVQQPVSGPALTATGQGDINFDVINCPPATASLGDRLWLDANGDGVQDAGEAGLTGVSVELLNEGGIVVASTTTGANGIYTFSNLPAGVYSVRVVTATLPAGSAPTYDLDGTATANIATAMLNPGQVRTDVDFGYRGTASVGDRVWTDTNGNGAQDAGEAGINGVTVELLNAGGTVIASQVTSGDGNYSFTNLSAGNYSVRVVAATLPVGLAQTYDLDGVGSANIASFALAGGQNRTDVDFGYRGTASVGDRVWSDVNGNGVQEAGETGINGVTVELLNSGGTVIASQATSGDGNYTFSNLAAGSYSVRVVTATLPAGSAQTYDLDGVGTANVAAFSLTGGQNKTDVDFGYRGTASVGDRVWIDTNGNGVQEAGETGINGVTVELLNSGGTVIASQVTAGDGNYTFSNLAAGNYSVRVVTATLPAGLAQTFDLDGVGTANVAAFTLSGGQNRTDVDFGYRGTASVGDRVWTDTNGNGVQEAGETGINGVTVELLNSGGTVIATKVTAGDGNYSFTNLLAGNYSVRVVAATLPAGLVQTFDLDGVGTANIAAFALAAGQNKTDVDFGYRGTASVGDRVWTDTNGNGVQDAGETGINGVTVELLNSGGTVIASQATSGDGNYSFPNLVAGNYSVRVVAATLPAGLAQTFDLDGVGTANIAAFTLAAGQNKTDVDFGYRGTASVGDRVWTDTNGNGVQDAGETGINGVTVELLNSGGTVIASQVTSGDGNYSFTNLVAGNYSVRVVAATLPAASVQTFDLDGVGTANIAAFALAAGQNKTDVDFGYRGTASVGDRVWTDTNGNGVQDAGEVGINGVTVELLNSGGTVIASKVTAGDGNYSFTNLLAGNYSVRVVTATLPAASVQTFDLDGVGTANIAAFSLTAGQNRTDVDFGYRGTASVGDRVWTDTNGNGVQDAGETGINGVTVELLNSGGTVIASKVTAGDGNYTFTNLLAGNYSVRVVTSSLPAGLAQTFDLDGVGTANIAAFSLTAGQNKTDVDFGYRGSASVGDRVWTDTNGNGVQDAGETGINGVTVELLNSGGTVIASKVTAGDGNYTFTNLVAGNYSVRVVASSLPAGLTQTYDLDGFATANIAAFALAAGQNKTDVDFGYRGSASVGDRVWTDTNGNGVQDAGEAGINGVTVELLNSGGTVIATKVTAGDGNYTFTNLAAGNYSVRVVTSSLPAGLAQTYDLDGVGTANVAAFALAAGQNKTDVDFGYRGTASIGDRVWYDTNGNGVQDAGEPGLNGATVELVNSGGTVIASQVTAGDGNYSFTNLAAGTYTVRVVSSTLPVGGLAPTFDLDGVATANTTVVVLAAGQNRTDVDFGYRGTRTVGDRVWNDTNGNGVQDAGEAGINGVTVRLFLGTTEVANLVTSGDGNYLFTTLPESTFTVRVDSATLPAGLTQTYDLDGLATPHQATFNLTTSRTDVDFGYRQTPTASLGDRVWNDVNGNGVQEASEVGLNGVTVRLLNSANTVVATQVTSGNGNYSFTGLMAGSYTAVVDSTTLPAGFGPTYDLDGVATPHRAAATLTAGQNRTDVDFGYRTADSETCAQGAQANPTYSSSSGGHSFWLPNIGTDFTFAPATGSFVQRADGTARLTGIIRRTANPSQAFIVDVTFSGFTMTAPANSPKKELLASAYSENGGPVNTATFKYYATFTGKLTGIETFAGAVINLTPAGPAFQLGIGANNKNINYGGSGWFLWTVTSQPTTGTAISQTTGQGDINIDLGNCTSCTNEANNDTAVQGTASNHALYLPGIGTDFQFAPAEGTFVRNADGTAHLTGTMYSVSSPTRGFNVDVTFSGYTATAPSGSPKKELSSSAYVENGGVVNPATWNYYTSFTGTLTGVSANAGASITITKTGPAFQVGVGANNKNRNFGGSGWFLWTVTSQPTSGSALTASGQGDINLDMFDCPSVSYGSVGNRVWKDTDGDGVQESGETGINGVTVRLVDTLHAVTVATQTTSGDGAYSFTNVVAGNYRVEVVTTTLPSGYTATFDLDGTSSASTATFALTAGQNRTDVDFGYKPAATCTAGYVKDNFSTASFSNNDGSLNWAAAWVESDTAGTGVSSGNVKVGTPYSGYMLLHDSPDTGGQPSAARQVSLTGFTSATLQFTFHTTSGVDSDDAAVIEVSKNGGSSYTVLETITGISGSTSATKTYNISSYIASNTRIRFRVSGNYGVDDEYFKVDTVRIDGSCAP